MSDTPERPKVEKDKHGRIIYRPDGAVLRSYIADNSRVAIIRGPIGSGKSVGSMMRVFKHATQQAPGPDKIRHSRWAIVRNSYPDLEQSTVKTWLGQFPEEQWGRFLWSKPMVHEVRIGDIDLEAVFLALDKPEDVRKLRSTEWTGIYINELQYTVKDIFDEATTRVGRYPAVKDGGPTWFGVIADMNAPDEDHFLPLMTGEVPFPEYWTETERELYRWPDEWRYFMQPPGLVETLGPDGKTVVGYVENPNAENRKWLAQGYIEMARGKTKPFIDSRLMNRITIVVDGDPVWTGFRRETHVAKQELQPLPQYPVYVGLDFGRRPAAVFGQMVNNRWQVLYELQRFDMGSSKFAPLVKHEMATRFAPNTMFRVYGDPKGRDKTQTFEATSYDIFAANGITVAPAPVVGNDIRTRIEAGDHFFSRMVDGMPNLISPACRSLVAACAGKYHLKRLEGSTEPVKDAASDIADAFQYMLIGAGEGRAMIGRDPTTIPKAVQTRLPRRSLRRARG